MAKEKENKQQNDPAPQKKVHNQNNLSESSKEKEKSHPGPDRGGTKNSAGKEKK
ncbi:hypothetical protein [Autumnicola musiva]|uniref:Uncharacterized protein n=1 Tax=Autumnicola musiva TaxID=3075589 RepID=A0ABU3DAS9_9FLAO|nr:hypothetical protein [Zunongwangia sp. F117]MDT0678624.1 hypothetical protein [Zunongwangia sp. F117]